MCNGENEHLNEDIEEDCRPKWGHHADHGNVKDGRSTKLVMGERSVPKAALHKVEQLPIDDINALFGAA